MTDLISRADAIEAVCMNDCGGCRPNECGAYLDKSCDVVKVLSALPLADNSNAKTQNSNGDLIYRADAIETVMAEGHKVYTSEYANAERVIYEADAVEALSMLPSAGPQTGELISRAEPTVIRSRTFVPTKDFKEWAKRIREVNPNAVVIPCDAEVVSADAVQGWIPCSERLPECGFGLHYLVTLKDGHDFMDDVYEAFFDKYGWHVGDNELADDDILAWMPLPKPYRGGDEE